MDRRVAKDFMNVPRTKERVFQLIWMKHLEGGNRLVGLMKEDTIEWVKWINSVNVMSAIKSKSGNFHFDRPC